MLRRFGLLAACLSVLTFTAVTAGALLASAAGTEPASTPPMWPDAAGVSPPLVSAMPGAAAVGAAGSPQGERSFPEHPGWPTTMGVTVNYAPGGGPATVDINGDGDLEVFAASTDQKLYGWRTDGTALSGFPISLSGMAQSSPAVGDIDGDGAAEILIATVAGWVYAFNTDGTAASGWPKHPGANGGAFVSVVLKDLDGDGTPEVIFPNGNLLYVWRGDGTSFPGFPASFTSSYGPCATPAVADLDGDGRLEIVLEGWEYLHVFHQDGTEAAGWPYRLPLSYDGFSYSAPALVDFDGDGTLEIAAGYHESGGGNWSGKAAVWHHDGTLAAGWPYVMADFGSWCYSTPALGDVDEDGNLEFAMTSHNGRLYLFRYDGTNVAGFPVQTGHVNSEASCAVADLDDDGHLEVCYGSNDTAYLGYERDGTVAPGFPTYMTGGMMVSGSCVADVDGDGLVNICCHDKNGKVHLWDLPYAIHADRLPWVRPHHDDFHTGFFGPSSPSGVPSAASGIGWDLAPIRPCPSGGRVTLALRGDPSGPVGLTLVDAAGRCLMARTPQRLQPGSGLDLDLARLVPGGVPAGVYFLRAEASGRTSTRSLVVLR